MKIVEPIKSVCIIIPTKDDNDRCNLTIRSIIIGCSNEHRKYVSIVVVDDASHEPFNIDQINRSMLNTAQGGRIVCVVTRLSKSIGPAEIRDRMTRNTSHEWVIFSDSHMTFPSGWSDLIIGRHFIPENLYCSVFVPQGNGITKQFLGSSFIPYTEKDGEVGFFNSDPLPFFQYHSIAFLEVPVIIGACYLINRQRFIDIGGYEGLTRYGSEEIFLSIKNYMMGGYSMVYRDLEVIHHDTRPTENRRDIKAMLQNKLVVARQTLTVSQWEMLLERLPRSRTLLQCLESLESIPQADLFYRNPFNEYCIRYAEGLTFEEHLFNQDPKTSDKSVL